LQEQLSLANSSHEETKSELAKLATAQADILKKEDEIAALKSQLQEVKSSHQNVSSNASEKDAANEQLIFNLRELLTASQSQAAAHLEANKNKDTEITKLTDKLTEKEEEMKLTTEAMRQKRDSEVTNLSDLLKQARSELAELRTEKLTVQRV